MPSRKRGATVGAEFMEDEDLGRFVGVDVSRPGRMVLPTGDGAGTTTRTWGRDDAGFFRYGVHDKFDTTKPTFMGMAIPQTPKPNRGKDNLVGQASGRVLQPGQWEALMPGGDIISEGAVSRSRLNAAAPDARAVRSMMEGAPAHSQEPGVAMAMMEGAPTSIQNQADARYAMTGMRTQERGQLVEPGQGAAKMFLDRFAGNMTNSVDSRKRADRRLTAMEAMEDRGQARASGEKITALQAMGERAKADAALQGRLAMADASVRGREVTAAGRLGEAEIKSMYEKAKLEARTELEEERLGQQKERDKLQHDIRTRALALREGQKWDGPDFTDMIGKTQTDPQTGAITMIARKDPQTGAPVYQFLSPNAYMGGSTTPPATPPPGQAVAAAGAPAGQPGQVPGAAAGAATGTAPVRMRAPDGTMRLVPAREVEQRKQAGAVVVG